MSNDGVLVRVHHADDRGNIFTLEEPFTLFWRDQKIDVPDHFESDGASVPRLFWRVVFPPGDQNALRAAIAHDYIYRCHPGNWSRHDADAMFFETMISDGVGKHRAFRAWLGVRLFGWIAWKKEVAGD